MENKTGEKVKEQKEEMAVQPMEKDTMFFSVKRFEFAKQVAKMFAESTMVPDQFKGAPGMANCMIALNLAERMNVDPFMLMQNMYVVHGRPGIEAKLAIALINGCGRFEPIQYEVDGEGKSRQCRAFAVEKKSKKTLYGPWVTWALVEAEGWNKPKGSIKSKWETMPEIMFRYRSAMFFARIYVPDVLVGLKTTDEIQDIDSEPVVVSDNQDVINENANKEVLDMDDKPDSIQEADFTEVKKEPVNKEPDDKKPEKEKPVYLNCPPEINSKCPRKSLEICHNCEKNTKCDPYMSLVTGIDPREPVDGPGY